MSKSRVTQALPSGFCPFWGIGLFPFSRVCRCSWWPSQIRLPVGWLSLFTEIEVIPESHLGPQLFWYMIPLSCPCFLPFSSCLCMWRSYISPQFCYISHVTSPPMTLRLLITSHVLCFPGLEVVVRKIATGHSIHYHPVLPLSFPSGAREELVPCSAG